MTVEQLISKLQEFPKDAEIVIHYESGFGWGGYYSECDPQPKYHPNQNKVYL